MVPGDIITGYALLVLLEGRCPLQYLRHLVHDVLPRREGDRPPVEALHGVHGSRQRTHLQFLLAGHCLEIKLFTSLFCSPQIQYLTLNTTWKYTLPYAFFEISDGAREA